MEYKDWKFFKERDYVDTQELINLQVKSKIRETYPSLIFNEELHRYTVKGQTMTSVSHTISKYVEPFDTELMATRVANKRTRQGDYTTQEEVLQEWEDKKNFACTKGTRVHLFGEDFPIKGGTPTDGYEKAVIKFWEELPPHIIPVAFELQMYCLKLGIAGTSDILLYNTLTKKFIIADYKTNEDIFKNFRGKRMLGKFSHLLDMAYSKYTLQLSYYQILFEKMGFEVESRVLIWLKPDGTYTNYWLDDVTNIILMED